MNGAKRAASAIAIQQRVPDVMKMRFLTNLKPALATILPLLGFAICAHADLPVIKSIQVEPANIVVTASVPAGHACIVLESRERFATGNWMPLAVKRVAGQAGTITFRLPRTADFGFLRVRADATMPLPASFYSGTNSFEMQATANPMNAYDAVTPGPAANGAPTDSREVVESDIWRLDGDTLYFFNQNRGLQVVDVSDPDHAKLLGTLNLPASGDQMYLLPSNHVALLTHTWCGSYYGAFGDSAILIVGVSNGVPTVVTYLSIDGYITESRLVGTALYVASQTTRPVPGSDGTTWESAMRISSFDLAVPEAPVARSDLWYPGYGNVVYATDRYFFAVTQNPTNTRQSVVNAIDITSPDGTMKEHETIQVAGRVADKFKLNWSDEVLSVISEVSSSPRLTKLETFSLPDPTSLPPTRYAKLGEVEVGHGEALYATRFDGTRAYIVTFLRVDPLWVVDLSDPAHPTVSGELEVPGWSTYIHPLGDRLVAVGVETNRTTVSLFDVSDPSHPALLSRVPLGAKYSYSEANSDEKAFNVLPDEGLILLPIQGYTTNGYQAWVQLIDLGTNSLTTRGIIEHDVVPRRATVHRDRIVSFSAVELLSVDAADRDHPQLTGQLTLAWPVNRVLLVGDYLLQIYAANGWYSQGEPSLFVTPVSDPGRILTRLDLTNAAVVGATVQNNRLYLAQALSATTVAGTNVTVTNTMWLTVVGLDALPALNVQGQTAADLASTLPGWGGSLEPVWPKPNLLVWAGSQNNFYYPLPWDVIANAGPVANSSIWWPYPYFNSGGRLFAFDVSSDSAPVFRSEVDLTTNYWWSFSRSFTTDGLVYLSHNAYVPAASTNTAWSPYYRSFLDVVDYADATVPTVRPPVNIPGDLKGISHNGSLLYTIGFHRANATNWYQGYQALDASAYDGVSAYLVDSVSLSNSYLHPAVAEGTNIFLANSQLSVSNSIVPTLETWTLNGMGHFTILGSVTLPTSAFELVPFSGLLAAQTGSAHVQVFDRSNPAALRQVGEGPETGCLNFSLRNGDAAPGRDLWLPLDIYGVTSVPLDP